MNVTQFISKRYLFSRKHISLISILTSISVIGITIGTALLIIILSVFNGFYDVIRSYLLTFDPDIRIEAAGEQGIIFNEDITNQITAHPEVVTVVPYVEGKAMLVFETGNNEVLNIRGIDASQDPFIMNLQEESGNSIDLAIKDGKLGAVLSESLINRYRLSPGDELTMLSPSGMRRSLTQFSAPRASRFTVRSSYNIHQIVDTDIVYVDIAAAQRLFNMPNTVSGFDVKLTDTDIADVVKQDLASVLGGDYKISTWYDLQKPLYDVMYLEKWGSYFILMIIVLVAALNIVGSLTMIVLQKKQDIGVLMSMGMTKKKIKKIFRNQGLYIGLIGSGIGGVVGLLITFAQKEFSLVKLSSSFIIDAYPVAIQISDIILVLLGTMTLCLLASWYPALRASNVQPADAVRGE
ncbi:MAG TPA: ABC transporter permease [Balneolaceae bacterium]|nr:ABC transporter permease [Balneolaceae bacterium]